MRILSFSTCPLDPALGSGKTRLRWSEGLRSLGHTVEVLEPPEFELWHSQKRALRFRQAWGASTVLEKKLRSGDYDLVEFFGGEFGLATWKLSKKANRPLIVAHTDGLEMLASERERQYNPRTGLKGKLNTLFADQTHERLSLAAFTHADAFVTGCELDRDFALERRLFPPSRAAVVEPGLDSEYLSQSFIAEKSETVCFSGSWIARKGIGQLSAVMSSVLLQEPRVDFHLYGTAESAETVLAHFPSQLHERIKIWPRITSEQMAFGLGQAKVFIFPSQYEGFGMALGEAMACSCAPVTTRTGFGAALRDGEEAILCDFNDTASMERAVLTLLSDDNLRLKIARNAWERVRSLSWETNVKKLEALYQRWVSEHRQPAGVLASELSLQI